MIAFGVRYEKLLLGSHRVVSSKHIFVEERCNIIFKNVESNTWNSFNSSKMFSFCNTVQQHNNGQYKLMFNLCHQFVAVVNHELNFSAVKRIKATRLLKWGRGSHELTANCDYFNDNLKVMGYFFEQCFKCSKYSSRQFDTECTSAYLNWKMLLKSNLVLNIG